MPITIQAAREPMAHTADVPFTPIKGAVYRRLREELLGYCEGRLGGRSFVVSGHRGAGKTTLMLAVVEDLRASGVGEREGTCRPFLVPVSGPDVYARPTKADVDPATDENNLLMHFARALHLAASREFVSAYRERARDPYRTEMLTAAAQLDLELRKGARLDALQRIWRVARAEQRGILFFEKVGAADQGIRELVALDSCAEGFQIAIGQVSDTSTSDVSLRPEGTPSEWPEAIKSLTNPVFSGLAGSAAGLGLFSVNKEASWALASVGVGLGVAVIFSRMVAARTQRDAKTSYTFTPDTTTSSLAWRLPCCIDALFAAGLAPVFVLDELDKPAEKGAKPAPGSDGGSEETG